MQPKTTYHKHRSTKIFFVLALLISISFFPGAGSNITPAFQQKTTTELVISYKVKTSESIVSFHKKVNSKNFTKSPASKKYELGFLFTYNSLTKEKLKDLSLQYSLIKSSCRFFRVKTIPQTSKENDFISFAG